MEIISNYRPRLFVYGTELTASERENFDWLEDIETADFVRYRGNVYHLSEFMRSDLPQWDGIHSESYFSGVLVKLIDSDSVIMGRYYV